MIMNFPNSFDYDIYRQNIDLQNMTNTELINHYNLYGKNEGRKCCKIFNRESLIKYIPSTLNCLEIGPFDCPVLIGQNIKYCDILSQEQLIKRAIDHNRNPATVPFIHYNNLNINEQFDLVLSAHLIEHQIDFIEHINNVSNILKPNGYYVLIIPDKRYCFDHFINETTIADIINMHVNKSTNHTVKSIIEHRTLTCHNNIEEHWNGNHGSQNLNSYTLINAINEYNNNLQSNSYIDVHSMQFTPKSFEDIVNLLYKIKMINMKIEKVYNTQKNSCEFFVILQKVN
jgi:hypothetical protein